MADLPMTDDEVLAELQEIGQRRGFDNEASHIDADELLTEVLRSLGYGKSMDFYDSMEKWYA